MSAMFHPPPQPDTRPPSVNVGVSRHGVTQHYSHTCNGSICHNNHNNAVSSGSYVTALSFEAKV